MTPADHEAIARIITETVGPVARTLAELIGAVVVAANAKSGIDMIRLREAFVHVASSPDASRLERSIVERVLALVEPLVPPSDPR